MWPPALVRLNERVFTLDAALWPSDSNVSLALRSTDNNQCRLVAHGPRSARLPLPDPGINKPAWPAVWPRAMVWPHRVPVWPPRTFPLDRPTQPSVLPPFKNTGSTLITRGQPHMFHFPRPFSWRSRTATLFWATVEKTVTISCDMALCRLRGSVGIVPDYGLDRWGSIPGKGKIFVSSSVRTSLLSNGYRG
jgi:hypothetical protein